MRKNNQKKTKKVKLSELKAWPNCDRNKRFIKWSPTACVVSDKSSELSDARKTRILSKAEKKNRINLKNIKTILLPIFCSIIQFDFNILRTP